MKFLIEVFEVDTELLTKLLRQSSGKELPDFTHVRGASETATIKTPVEHRADSVRTFLDVDHNPVLAAIIEVQLAKKPDKQWTWPVFVAEARRVHMCPTVVLVVVPNADVAAWARRPLDLGLGCSFVTPLVVDLSELSLITDEAVAADDVGMATLAILVAKAPQKAMDALEAALARTPQDQAEKYAGYLLSALRGAALDYWRNLMATGSHAYQNDYARELISKAEAEGILEGEAKMLFTVLTSRGIAIPAEARQRIESCEDSNMFDAWIVRAVSASTIDDVLNEAEAGSASSQ